MDPMHCEIPWHCWVGWVDCADCADCVSCGCRGSQQAIGKRSPIHPAHVSKSLRIQLSCCVSIFFFCFSWLRRVVSTPVTFIMKLLREGVLD